VLKSQFFRDNPSNDPENFFREAVFVLEIDRYRFFEADTDISKHLKYCFLLHYQKCDVFYALPFFQNLKNQDLDARIFEIAAFSILD